jgi:hypothetical protein
MRRILLMTLAAVSLVGVGNAQEATGPTAEKVKKEIIQLEREKIEEITTTTTTNDRSIIADWEKQIDADDIDFESANGVYQTKAQIIDGFAAGKHKTWWVKPYDEHVRVYGDGGNGTVAVITYLNVSYGLRATKQNADCNFKDPGCAEMYKPGLEKSQAVDVFLKLDGRWKWLVHHHGLCGKSPVCKADAEQDPVKLCEKYDPPVTGCENVRNVH